MTKKAFRLDYLSLSNGLSLADQSIVYETIERCLSLLLGNTTLLAHLNGQGEVLLSGRERLNLAVYGIESDLQDASRTVASLRDVFKVKLPLTRCHTRRSKNLGHILRYCSGRRNLAGFEHDEEIKHFPQALGTHALVKSDHRHLEYRYDIIDGPAVYDFELGVGDQREPQRTWNLDDVGMTSLSGVGPRHPGMRTSVVVRQVLALSAECMQVQRRESQLQAKVTSPWLRWHRTHAQSKHGSGYMMCSRRHRTLGFDEPW